MKTYIHERTDENGCMFGWVENDTQAPNQVRHECNDARDHASFQPHICACGLAEEE